MGVGGIEGFFTLAYTERLPDGFPERAGGIVAHFEPKKYSLLEDTNIYNARIDGVSHALAQKHLFNFDDRIAQLHTVPVGIQEETFIVVPGRRKCLYYLKDLFQERTGYIMAPMPALFSDFEEMRETLALTMPDLHAVGGLVQQTDWYNMMVEETREGIIRAKEQHNNSMLERNVHTLETCFPRAPGFRFQLYRAIANPDPLPLRQLLEQV